MNKKVKIILKSFSVISSISTIGMVSCGRIYSDDESSSPSEEPLPIANEYIYKYFLDNPYELSERPRNPRGQHSHKWIVYDEKNGTIVKTFEYIYKFNKDRKTNMEGLFGVYHDLDKFIQQNKKKIG